MIIRDPRLVSAIVVISVAAVVHVAAVIIPVVSISSSERTALPPLLSEKAGKLPALMAFQLPVPISADAAVHPPVLILIPAIVITAAVVTALSI